MKTLLFNWRSTLVGLGSLIYGVVAASGDATLTAAIHDPKLHLALILALLGFITKDGKNSGTADHPRS